MISAPSEMRCSEMPAYSITTKVIASTSGIDSATTSPARMPRLTKLTASTIATASNSARVKPPTASSTTTGWSETRCTPTPTGRSPTIRSIAVVQRLAEFQQVGAGLHPDGEPDRRLAAEAEQRRRRVGVAAGDGGDVAQPEEAVVDPEVDAAQAFLGRELAADPQADALGPGLDHAGRGDGVLRLQRLDDRLLVDAERGELAGREFEVDHLVLRADQLDPAGVRHRQDLGAHRLDVVAQLALAQAVGGEGVDVAEDVAETVVEGRADHALGEIAADVVDHVADLHPGRGHCARRRRRVLEVDVDRRLARASSGCG